jgi:hypothetical protein
MTGHTDMTKALCLLWVNESAKTQNEGSRILLIGGRRLEIDGNPDNGDNVMELALQALDQTERTMQDFVNLFRIKPSELYDLDDAVMKSLERDTLENQVHNVLNPGHSKKKDYGLFRQLAIDAASMHPTSLEALAPNVKTAHDAAVLLLGPLYDTPELDETTATAVIAAVSEQAPFDRLHDEDGERVSVVGTPQPAVPAVPELLDGTADVDSAGDLDLLDGTADELSEEEMNELRAYVPLPSDIVNGTANRDTIAKHLGKMLYKHREFRNIHHKKAFVMFLPTCGGFT